MPVNCCRNYQIRNSKNECFSIEGKKPGNIYVIKQFTSMSYDTTPNNRWNELVIDLKLKTLQGIDLKWEFSTKTCVANGNSFDSILMDARCTRSHTNMYGEVYIYHMCTKSLLYATKSDILDQQIDRRKYPFIKMMGKQNERRQTAQKEKILERRVSACKWIWSTRIHISKLWQWTGFYAYNHIFDIFFYFYVIFPIILYLLLQRVWEKLYTERIQIHINKQSARVHFT